MHRIATPGVLPDDRVVFFESANDKNLIRIYDIGAETMKTANLTWYPFGR